MAGERKTDVSVQAVLKQMSSDIKKHKISIDTDTCLAIVEFCNVALPIATQMIQVRMKQSASGYTTTRKRALKKKK